MHEISVWVLIDSSGNAVCSMDPDTVAEKYDEDIGEDAGKARRLIEVKLRVPVPDFVILEGTVPHEGKAELTVKG